MPERAESGSLEAGRQCWSWTFRQQKHHRSHPCLTHRSSERPEPILSGMVGLCHPCLLHPPGGIIDCDGEFITTGGGHGHPPLITVPGGSRFTAAAAQSRYSIST